MHRPGHIATLEELEFLEDERNALARQLLQEQRQEMTAEQIMLEAATAVGSHLGISRAGFFEIRDDRVDLLVEWTAGALPILGGNQPLSAIWRAVYETATAGRPIHFSDARTDEMAARSGLLELGILSALAAPITRAGQWIGGFYTTHTETRPWTASDIRFVQLIANQTWTAVMLARNRAAAAVYEAKAHASEAQARRVLENIGDAVIVTNAQGRINRMNPVAERVTGWTLVEAFDKPLAEVFHIINESTRQTMESPADKVLRLGTVVGLANHTILIGKEGKEVHIDDSAAPVRDETGTLTGVVLVFRDSEERRDLEKKNEGIFQELHATLSKLKIAMEFAGQGSFFYDETTGLITVDAVTQELFELQSTSGPAEYWISKVHPDDQQRVAEVFAAAAAGKAPYILEHRIVRSDGIRWLDARAKILSEPGQPMVFTGVCEDITSRKHAEAALLQNEKLAAVGRLASIIAHEINNPLEAVTNLLYLARHAESIEGAIPFLESADGELRRAARIASQALRFHKQATRPTAASFGHLVDRLFAGRHRKLQNADATEYLRDRTTRPILCFEGEIRQVLSNFVGNAIDALQATGGKLLVRARDGHDWRTGRAGMVLTVADTGTGISKATRTRVFDAFFTTKGDGGTGLGLWISRDIVERHAGITHLRSSQNPNHHGSVFTIFLPYQAMMRGYAEELKER